MKKFIFILALLALIFPKTASATEAVNKFGIHILEPSDLPKAEELVNSSGGDWGWVTVVIREDDMNFDKWQNFMDDCRERHLVPLVRIATHLEGENWTKPKPEDVSKWADFLNQLNWPTEDQYVIIFNEPNQAKEWGGEVNPKEYARILNAFIDKFKIYNLKFKILNAGLDLAAPNSKSTMDAFKFMEEVNWEVPGIFAKLDGWASHSYPNHGFLGKPRQGGKTSIRGYDWELTVLKNIFKVEKELPVFITETGWPKNNLKFKIYNLKLRRNLIPEDYYYDQEIVAGYVKSAFENVWLKDDRVKAVTPFVLNYPGDLFADFSWLDKDGNPYPQFELIKNMEKISWWPEQEEKYELKSIFLPPFLPANTKFEGSLILKNLGQSILGEKEKFTLPAKVFSGLQISDISLPEGQKIKPNESIKIDFSITSSTQSGEFEFSWGSLPKQKLRVFPASLISRTQYTLWQKIILKIEEIFH